MNLLEQAAYSFIENYIETNQEAPNYREIAAAIKVPTTSRIKKILEGIEEAGLIKLKKRPRGIILQNDNFVE